jgi:predicted helicase
MYICKSIYYEQFIFIMIGLYLLTTEILDVLKTVKFGMSMRLEFRWIDYFVVFNDAKYIYYYEFLDNLDKQEILNIENEIIQLHMGERNKMFQTEYFHCNNYDVFHDSIVKVLDKKQINYKIHNVHNFQKRNYDYKPETLEHKQNNFEPHYYQKNVLDTIDIFYGANDIGKIIWACGLGKALLSILIVQKLNYKSVVIGVPSIQLQRQMKNEIIKIFNNHENILFVGGEIDCNVNSTTNKHVIQKFINKKSSECKFIIATYASCYLLADDNIFDFKIGDEAHHLVCVEKESEKTYEKFHKIKSHKTLFMTATEKIASKIEYTMDNENVFGKYIDVKTIHWAIENKKITDYNLIILKNTEDEIDNIIGSLNLCDKKMKHSISHNKELFLSAFMSLKSIEKYNGLTHILIYTNKIESSVLVEKYINIILQLNVININQENYYNKALCSNSKDNLSDGLTKFMNASWGIISCVYIFGEGFDCPKLNGVVFGENMESDIRIVQSVLRPNRLDSKCPDKKAYVMIPYIDTENFLADNNSFDKCRKIISKIRNVDEKIEHKINVISFDKLKIFKDAVKKNLKKYYCIVENGNELKKIMLRLRYSNAINSKYSEEQNEFNYVKCLNKELNIQSKEEYSNKKTIKNHKMYIKNPDEYFKSTCVWTNWYDFIGVNTKKFIQNKNDWVIFCKEKKVKSLDDYLQLCHVYDELPLNPADFYRDFSTVPSELNLNKERR